MNIKEISDFIRDNINFIIIRIILLIVVLLIILPIMNEQMGIPYNCENLITVKYKVIGTGGLFGGSQKIETISDDFDGYMEKCNKWKGLLWGEYYAD